MLDWFLSLSRLSQIWVGYGLLVLTGLILATTIEFTRSRKVNGAPGWMFFAWGMVTGYGLLAMLLLSLLAWFFR